MKIVVFGLSLSSSWGNGHATTYRALLAALAARGHDILFLERDQPWYAAQRDLVAPSFCRWALYDGVAALASWRRDVAAADLVIIGSYVADGVGVARWVRSTARRTIAFYDIDTPVTLAKLAAGDHEYLAPAAIPEFDLYLSFTGGPTLRELESRWGARRAEAFYCAVDPASYRPLTVARRWDLGYLGTYSGDRQPALERLLIEPARLRPDLRFVVAGPQYPDDIAWPHNVERIDHLPPSQHAAFYSSLGWTLNVTRADMRAAGWSPSVRLFEAAACATPIVSDAWPGIEDVLRPGQDIVLADDAPAVLAALAADERTRSGIGAAARRRVLAAHTAAHRAASLERWVGEIAAAATPKSRPADRASHKAEGKAASLLSPPLGAGRSGGRYVSRAANASSAPDCAARSRNP